MAVVVRGTGVVAGIAYGPAVWVRPRPQLPERGEDIPESQREDHVQQFLAAAAAVADRLKQRANHAEGDAQEVLVATAGMAMDRGWHKTVKKNIAKGQSAPYAVRMATQKFVEMFEAAGGLMAERTTDLKDVRDRVIAELRGEDEPGLPDATRPSILLADDLSPADTAGLDTSVLTALVTELGGPTSHTAIIARQLGLPCIVAAGAELRDIPAGEPIMVDGQAGTLSRDVDPDDAQAAVAESRERQAAIAAWQGPAATSDGKRIQLLANVADPKAARAAAETAAEGIGLYRTEMSFLSTAAEPSVADQARLYGEVFSVFGHNKVVVRALDAGSDKPIAYATLDDEENPALGVRGLRLATVNEGLITRQLDAIAAAAADRPEDATTWVMAPMVATEDEAAWFAEHCRTRGLVAGAMVEIPAAALMADVLMRHLDFVSIGTNDLTQYTMAADRLSPQLASLTDPWQPAVLSLINLTCQAGARQNVPVGVCGEAAADPLLACVLVGMGVSSLSMAPNAIPAVGAQLAGVSFATCQALAQSVLATSSAAGARAAAAAALA